MVNNFTSNNHSTVKIIQETETVTHEDAEGNITSSVTTKTKRTNRNSEPPYIKIYTNMWCDLYEIPSWCRDLFMKLAVNMSYADSEDPDGGQLVAASGPVKDHICKELNWQESMFYRGLRKLVEFGAIRKVKRGWYQINPSYAGRGEWLYDPVKHQGGIEDIRGYFSIADKQIKTEIIWADDKQDTDINKMYRAGLGVEPSATTVLRYTEA